MREVVIVAAKRSAIGSFGGSLSKLSAVELGTQVVKQTMESIKMSPTLVDEVLMGNILSAGLGQNPARQIGRNAGCPDETTAMTINMLCGSGLRAVILGAQSIMLGDADCIIAGGTESMSNAPYLMPSMRFGKRMGNGEVLDTMIHDGLTDAFHQYHMGITAENIAERWNLSRESQDNFALASQSKAEVAMKEGKFESEIVPVTIKNRRGDIVIDCDEYPKAGMTLEKLASLRPAFKKEGTVTAGNASGINDGAACIILMEKEKAKANGFEILATLKGYGSTALDPAIMGYGPVEATKKALKRANWTVDDLELVEANEAFAAQSLAVCKDLGLKNEMVNVHGGAIALGHPIGASGARILVTLLHAMERYGKQKGLATLCIGGGQGTAVVIERGEH